MLLNVHYDLLPMREALDVVVLSGLGLVRIFCIFLYMFSYLGPIVFRMFFSVFGVQFLLFVLSLFATVVFYVCEF